MDRQLIESWAHCAIRLAVPDVVTRNHFWESFATSRGVGSFFHSNLVEAGDGDRDFDGDLEREDEAEERDGDLDGEVEADCLRDRVFRFVERELRDREVISIEQQ